MPTPGRLLPHGVGSGHAPRSRWALALLGLAGCARPLQSAPGATPSSPADARPATLRDAALDAALPALDAASSLDARTPPLDAPLPEARVETPPAALGATPLRRLTSTEYRNTLRALFGDDARDLPLASSGDQRGAHGFRQAVALSDVEVRQYFELADQVTSAALPRLEALVPCDRHALGDEACDLRWLDGMVHRVARGQELASDRLLWRAYRQELLAQGVPRVEALRLVLVGLLDAPSFLYRLERGWALPSTDSVRQLTGAELATRLSFLLWSSAPDDSLLTAGDRGELATPEGLRAWADLMLSDERARDGLEDFFSQWLELDALEVPGRLEPELRDAAHAELRDFVFEVLARDDARLRTLLTAPYLLLEPRLASLYGLPSPSADAPPSRVLAPAGERVGLLTNIGWLSAHGSTRTSVPIQRGVWLSRRLLCSPVASPPPELAEVVAAVAPDAPPRETYDTLRATPLCSGCHAQFNGLGLAFESWDLLGRYRSADRGAAIDPSASVRVGLRTVTFRDARSLLEQLVDSAEVRDCVTRQWFRFALGRTETVDDEPSVQQARAALEASDGSLRALLLALVQSPAFRYFAPPRGGSP